MSELDVYEVVSGSIDVLELNLLHLSWSFRFEPLRLNKSGAPNRRSLLRTARGVVMPGMLREIGDDVDLNDPEQIDYLSFLMALSLELGTLATEIPTELSTTAAPQDSFFKSADAGRTRKIHDALTRLRFWNELRSHAFWEDEHRDEEHLSLLAPTGERLIGARGAVFSVLRRRAPEDWTSVETLTEWCREQHDDYLDRALTADVATQGFVHAVVRRALSWSGLADIGMVEGEPVFRLTVRGRTVFGLAVNLDGGPVHKGLVVQPNLEVTAMLDATPIGVLHELYRIAERRTLADRVATFTLSGRTVQRGYAAGGTAKQVLAILNERGVTPVPDAIEFQLNDWERMHRRVTVFADGILFRHPDPDKLDLSVGQLHHENPDVEFVRLGPSTTFAASAELAGLRRLFEREGGLEVDVLGDVPPCIAFTDSLEVQTNPLECDVITAFELAKIAESLSVTRTAQIWRLDPDKVRKRWPEEPFDHIIEFLEPRTIGGLPPVQYLKLRSVLDQPTRASVRRDVTVLTIDSVADARRLAEAPEVAPFIIGRLGDRTFAIDPESEMELLDVLHEIGIRGGNADG